MHALQNFLYRIGALVPKPFPATGVSPRFLSGVLLLFLFSFAGLRAQDPLRVGYAYVQADPGMAAPVGSALFSLFNADGVLVSQAGVGGVVPLRSGRIFVEESNGVDTGVALANPENVALTIDLILRDAAGSEMGTRALPLGPNQHLARFIRDPDLFPGAPAEFFGSLTFQVRESGRRVAAITIRQSVNGQGEPVFATLPVVDLEEAVQADSSIVFPHIGAGGSLSTQIVLIGRGNQQVDGQIRLVASDGTPLAGQFNGASGSMFNFSLPANGVFQGTLTSSGDIVQGYAVVTPSNASVAPPAGSAVFQFRDSQDQLVSEAGVGASAATRRARIFVDTVGTQTGIAIANPGNAAVNLTFTLLDRFGFAIDTTTRPLAGGAHMACFAEQLFEDLPFGFTGQLDIRGPASFVPITLKLTVNSRNDLILTTLPVADLFRPLIADRLIFPQIGFGEFAGLSISTRLVLIRASLAAGSTGELVFVNSDGTPLEVEVTGQRSDRFRFGLSAGSARQLRPENDATAAEIVLDPSDVFGTEIGVSVGETRPLRPLVIDSDGQPRDDFEMTFRSVNQDVATINRFGRIVGRQQGFSTLTVSAGTFLVASTIHVVEVEAALEFPPGINDQEFDSAGRFYLAGSVEHQILLAEGLSAPPDVYAGVGIPDFLDAARLLSRFNLPTYLAINRQDSSLYISDSGNHRIRQVFPGPDGAVITLGGTGTPGWNDGPLAQALFNNPQGTALDSRGFLWIADTDNHVIRRIDLQEPRTVQTIAGTPGVAGFRDRDSTSSPPALFDTPTGIAFEPEPRALQMERVATGTPPPPVSVIVTDTANGQIRRVLETGEVTTIPAFVESQQTRSSMGGRLRVEKGRAPARFDSPAGVAVDPFGVIYVSEPDTGRVLAVLPEGGVVSLGGRGLFGRPQGLAVSPAGELAVAGGDTVRRVRFGAPVIERITPGQINTRGGQLITIEGVNFSAETVVLVGSRLIRNAAIQNTNTIVFPAPASLPTGLNAVILQNRGGTAQGNLLVRATALGELRPGEITTVAGGGRFARDGTVGPNALISRPIGLAVDAFANVYVADGVSNRVRRIDAVSGVIETVAGLGPPDPFIDNTAALEATLDFPFDTAVDLAGNVYIADANNHRIRRIAAETGQMTTVAGTGQPGFDPDDVIAASALLNTPLGVGVDESGGSLYIADSGNHRIRRVDFATGRITTVAGNGVSGYNGDDQPARRARLAFPSDVFFVGTACTAGSERCGTLLIADTANHRIREVDLEGVISTVAGTGQGGFSGEGGPAVEASLRSPNSVAANSQGEILIADTGNNRIRKIDVNGTIDTIAGGPCCDLGDGGPAEEAFLLNPFGLAVDSGGNVYVSDTIHNRVRKIDARSGVIQTLAGSGPIGDEGPAEAAVFLLPVDVDFDPLGDLLIADQGDLRVRRLDFDKDRITTAAGNGLLFAVGPNNNLIVGDGGPATLASVGAAGGVAVDSAGNVFIADFSHHRVRRVDARTGVITTVAGTGAQGFSGDGGPAVLARLNAPLGVALDSADRLYITDNGNNVIRMVDGQGVIRTIAGNREAGFNGDQLAVRASLNLTIGGKVVVDDAFQVYIADTGNNRVRRIDQEGFLTTIAGNGEAESSGDGGSAREAGIRGPLGLAFDSDGDLYVSTSDNQVRRISNGRISLVAGTGAIGSEGDGGAARRANLNFPVGLVFDRDGNLYIADSFNQRIRAVRGPIP